MPTTVANLPVTVEAQLAALAAAGVRFSPTLDIEDLFLVDERKDIEAKPFDLILVPLASGFESDGITPTCTNLCLWDTECIEGDGSYIEIIERLQSMSDNRLPLKRVHDYVDKDDKQAWVEFELDGQKVHWDLTVDGDSVAPELYVHFDALLVERTDLRLRVNVGYFGQEELLACLTPAQFDEFAKLSKVSLRGFGE